jgi:hypothetical protein
MESKGLLYGNYGGGSGGFQAKLFPAHMAVRTFFLRNDYTLLTDPVLLHPTNSRKATEADLNPMRIHEVLWVDYEAMAFFITQVRSHASLDGLCD